MATKKKLGRPVSASPRTDAVRVNLRADERKRLEAVVERDGLPISTWARRVLMAAVLAAETSSR